METDLREALAARLLAMGDDEVILGHRDSEWCGHAPILEEDIAFANLALDEIGHAQVWYSLHAELLGKDAATYPDELVYRRRADEFRHAPLLELPRGDWAFSMLRQYLFDLYEMVMMSELVNSQNESMAAAAVRIGREEIYHRRHTQAWVRRLGLGTEESRMRMQTALAALWPHVAELFHPLPGDADLIESGMIPHLADVQTTWEAAIRPWLTESNLVIPEADPSSYTRTHHTEHLPSLLDDLQEVVRLYPQGTW
jgi:ring-1,2-phenylacetyl-CoA epoxidase subunit PaaC